MPIDRALVRLAIRGSALCSLSSLLLGIAILLQACDPVVLPPFPPPRDAPGIDTNRDAPLPDVPPRDAPRPDVPGLDAPFDDVQDEDGGDPDFDGGMTLPITIDGVLDEIEWEDTAARIAESSAVGGGGFIGCELRSLRALHDATSIYVAVEGVLCIGAIVIYASTGASGVNLALTPLGDLTGDVDAVASRAFVNVEPSALPSFAWGTSFMPAAASPATDELGWRTLSQDGPHVHATSDLSACTETACETRIPRTGLGSPRTLRLAVRLATPDTGSLLALPPEADADIALLNFANVPLVP